MMQFIVGGVFIIYGIRSLIFGGREIRVKNKFIEQILKVKFGEKGCDGFEVKVLQWVLGVISITIGLLIIFTPIPEQFR